LPGDTTNPRLSIVATSRNDDHGGHLLQRMQWFIDALAWNAVRRGLSIELLLVEWNPPADRPPLAEVLEWRAPEAKDGLTVRIVTVPGALHQRLVAGGGLPMMQMIAKNVGIRRASGENVLATNIDIILSPQLFDAATAALGSGSLWRADRYDVVFPFPPEVTTVEEALAFCDLHPLRYERRDGIYYPGHGRTLPIFQGLSDYAWWQTKTVLRRVAHRQRQASSSPSVPPRLKHETPSGRSPGDLARHAADRLAALYGLAVLPALNVNASGDFTLLSRHDWWELRGYPEWVVHSLHLDTIFLHQVFAAGLAFVDFEPPAVAYHLEHAEGSGWTPEGHEQHLQSVANRGMPIVTPARLRQEKLRLRAARRRGQPVLYNRQDWGFANTELSEWTPRESGGPRSGCHNESGSRSSGTATTS